MNIRLRGIIGGFSGGGAPRPSGAGSTRQPFGWRAGGGAFSAGGFSRRESAGDASGGESGTKGSMYSWPIPAVPEASIWNLGWIRAIHRVRVDSVRGKGVVGTLVVMVVLAVVPAVSPAAGTLKGDYQLEGNRFTSCGTAPNLRDVGPGSNAFATESVGGSPDGVLTFPADNGLSLNTQGVVPQDRFTVIMQFRLEQVGGGSTGYRSLLVFDSDPPTRDSGLYVHQGSLNFYDDLASPSGHQETGQSVAAGQYIEVALTRNAPGLVVVYANGAPRISYDDSPNGAAVLLSNAIEFFKENGDEESAGAVARIRIYDDALSPAEVSAPPGCPQPPQICAGRQATISGTAGNDKLTGTAKPDVVAALGGNDKVSGGKGNDLICGGAGRDTLKGGAGRDTLRGEAGKDVLKGGPLKDKLIGGPGRDKQLQ